MFESKLTSTLQGFYKGSFYDEETKADSTFVSTQFSPIDCRRAFPSFDRPMFKATFKISLIRSTDKNIFMSEKLLSRTLKARYVGALGACFSFLFVMVYLLM